jgi:single-stranded DNA-binding protein
MSKGRKVIVWGRMTQEEWEDKETGKKRSKTIVIAENWTFGDSDKGGQSGDRAPRQEAPRRESPAPSRREVPSGGGDDGDDIPFAPFEKHSPLPL